MTIVRLQATHMQTHEHQAATAHVVVRNSLFTTVDDSDDSVDDDADDGHQKRQKCKNKDQTKIIISQFRTEK